MEKKQEIKFDERNYRKHSKRNKALIKKSLEELGAGRSVVIDADDTLVAGNGVFEQAQALQMPVRVIETDGSELVVVKRTDIHTQDEKRRKFAKPCYDPAGNVHKCCLCKAAGGFFGVEKCTVPCVMYNSNKSGELVINKYGFAV